MSVIPKIPRASGGLCPPGPPTRVLPWTSWGPSPTHAPPLTTNPGSAPADNCKLYGIYIPYILAQNEKQKIPHSLEYLHFSASTVYMCFLSGFSWQKVPVNINILNQWFLVTKLNSSFCKLNSRLHDLLTVMLCLCNIWPGML
jgi:hypothetical protein